MSATIQVFLKDANLPTVDAWNAAIKAGGFDLVLDPFDPRKDDGYRPAMLKGAESGFEWFISPLKPGEVAEMYPDAPLLADCDLQADLSYSSYADEDVATSIAAAVLASMTGGFYVNTEEGTGVLNGSEALATAREAVLRWQGRGPWKPTEPPPLPPSALAAPVPPFIAPAKPPPVPAAALPKSLDIAKFRLYRICCGLFVLLYLSFIVYFILITNGVVDPSLGIIDDLATRNDPAARAEAIAKERQDAFGGGVVSAVGALFYAAAAFVPRKPSGWTIGLVAIIGMFFPFFITAALMIPLLPFWLKPETKRAFLKTA